MDWVGVISWKQNDSSEERMKVVNLRGGDGDVLI